MRRRQLWGGIARPFAPGSAGGLRAVIILFIDFASMTFAALPARADNHVESAQDYVQPFVTRMQYQSLLDSLNLDRNQKSIAEMLYSEYSTLIDVAVDKADQLAAAAGRDTVADVLAGKQRATAEELRRMRSEVVKAYTSVWPAADFALDHLVSGATALLTDAQHSMVEPQLRAWRRAIHLEPLRDMQFSSEYAGEGVCLLDLAAAARLEGGELVGVDRAQLNSLLEQYELALDEIIIAGTDVMRSAPVEKRIAAIQKDDAAERNAQARMLEPWQQIYQLNRRTAVAVGELIEHPDGRALWIDRFDRACFPWLLEDDKIDRQYQWLAKQSMEGRTWTSIQTAYDIYREKQRLLAQSMIEMIVNARLTMAAPLHPMMDPTAVPAEASALYEEMIKLTGQQKAAATTMGDVITSSLNESQRKALNRAVR